MLSLSFSESMRKMLHNGGVESFWGALGACFLRVSLIARVINSKTGINDVVRRHR